MPFDFNESYVLEDDHALLRPLRADDYEHLLEYSINEPNTWQYSLLQANGPEKLKTYLQISMDAKEAQKEYPFIVFDKALGKYVGSTRFYDIQLPHQATQLGYTWYSQHSRGTGLNKHCKLLMLDFAFGPMGMERVEFRADNRNERSIAAMKSIGCTVEGILRSTSNIAEGGRRDSIVLSILKEEWERELRAKLLAKL